jgi:hypothetical protein
MSILYSTDGRGNWTKTAFYAQCEHTVFLRGKCQARLDHEGPCWAYGPDGSYCWDINNQDLKDDDICSGSTPPGHKEYIHPIDKVDEYYMSNPKTVTVTDTQLIERLERGEMEDGESITRPVDTDL